MPKTLTVTATYTLRCWDVKWATADEADEALDVWFNSGGSPLQRHRKKGIVYDCDTCGHYHFATCHKKEYATPGAALDGYMEFSARPCFKPCDRPVGIYLCGVCETWHWGRVNSEYV